MTKKNEGKTPEQIVAARVAENEKARVANKLHVLRTVDHFIEFLQVNRESIGGLSVNLMADTGKVLFDPQDNDACEGVSFQISTRASITDSMDKHLQNIIDGDCEDDTEVRVAHVGLGDGSAFDISKLLAGLGGERSGH